VGVNLTDVEVVAAGELASWGRRLVALIIDSVVLATIVTLTVLAAGVPLDELNSRIREGQSLLILLLVVVPEAIYTTTLVGSLNQTFGKMAVGIKVVDAENRSPIGYRRAFTRWLSTAALWAMLWVPGIIDHLWPLRDDRKQSFHDKFARSVVVRA
jgi:uncharacterized RDD family membrane protein YckC